MFLAAKIIANKIVYDYSEFDKESKLVYNYSIRYEKDKRNKSIDCCELKNSNL
jgi:hypothetical protein